MLALRLFKLLLGFLELHSQEFDLLVTHGDILLRIVCDLHLCLETLLDFPFKLFDERLLRLELSLSFLKSVTEHDLVVYLLLALTRCKFLQLGLALCKLDAQGLLDLC